MIGQKPEESVVQEEVTLGVNFKGGGRVHREEEMNAVGTTTA
jgi:hypothetical protein